MLFSGVKAIFCVYLIFSATSLSLPAFVSDVEQVENLSERGGLRVSVSLRCYVESERLCLIVLVSTCTCAVLDNQPHENRYQAHRLPAFMCRRSFVLHSSTPPSHYSLNIEQSTHNLQFQHRVSASNSPVTMKQPTLMLRISLLVGLVYGSSHVLATSLSDHVTYQCSGKSLIPGLPRLDEASIDDLNILQASGAVTSVDLVCMHVLPSQFFAAMLSITRHTLKESMKSILFFALSVK